MKTKLKRWFKKLCFGMIKITGCIGLVFIILAFTDLPYYAYHSLSLNYKVVENADAIILMGGKGMPSAESFLRIYNVAQLSEHNPDAAVVIAAPLNNYDSTNQLDLMKKSLIAKGVCADKIQYSTEGYNTRTQAIEVSKTIPLTHKIIIVSSAEHMFRAIRSFEKVGFKIVGSGAAFDTPLNEEELKSKKEEEESLQNLTLRYHFWSYMVYEIKVIREYIAITYYWLKGWI